LDARGSRRPPGTTPISYTGVPTFTNADAMPGANDKVTRIYAAMALKERELISEPHQVGAGSGQGPWRAPGRGRGLQAGDWP
jgi:hypothetical protein